MAQVELKLKVIKRWFFGPALVVIVLLGRVGMLRDQHKAARWLADRAMRIEVA